MIINDKLYDILATIQRLLAPLATFIVAIAGIWGWTDFGQQIAATISAAAILLGAALKICSDKYFDAGTIMFLNEMHKEDEE